MRSKTETLFSTSNLQQVKQQTVQDLKRDIAEDNPMYGMQGTFEQKLFTKYRLPVATITRRENRVQGDTVEHVIHFEGGNGGFFHYNPTKKSDMEKPSGYTISNAVYFYLHNTDDAASLKVQIREIDDKLDAWFSLVQSEVQEFNDTLPKLIEQAVAENQSRKEREKQLEDELNT